MKRSIVLLYMILAICFAFSPSNMLAAQTATPYLYAFVQQAENGTIKISAISPTNPSNSTDVLALNTINRDVVQDVVVSPNSEWLALVLDGYTTKSLRLANVVTGEVRDIPVELINLDFSSSYLPAQEVVWSPNGRFLAFIGEQNNVRDLYIYSMEDKTLINLTNDPSDQYRIVSCRK